MPDSVGLHDRLGVLEETYRATLNILEDADEDRRNLEQVQQATMNLLEDFDEERQRLQLMQTATLNLLEDFHAERERFSDAQKALINILEDIEVERANTEQAKAVVESVNRELETFSYSVSHDLRAPLRAIDGFSQALLDFYAEKVDARGQDWLKRIRAGCQRMGQLIDDLLSLSRTSRAVMRRQSVNLTAMAQEIADELRQTAPQRQVQFRIAEGLTAMVDRQLLRPALWNLLENAWKFTAKRPEAVIELGRTTTPPTGAAARRTDWQSVPRSAGRTDWQSVPQQSVPQGETVYFVRDNGAGFDMAYADKLFGPFQRLHPPTDFPGSGIGLALVQRIVRRHGGRIWADAAVDRGATFYFTLNEQGESRGP